MSVTQQDTNSKWPKLGSGIGLRTVHYPLILKDWPKMDWFEAISENYMDSGGRPIFVLEQIRERYPVALHGVSLSIGSVDPLDEKYLTRLKALCERIDPAIVSDHLCWSGVEGEALHDLLPLPFTEEAILHIVERVQRVQEVLKRPILLENVSSYVTYKHSQISEWEFITEIAKRSGCGILLDLNNVYVNAVNHNFDPYTYIRAIPKEFVGQFHLAGHTNMGSYLFDTHSAPIIDSVWDLYKEALRLFGPVSTLIEWDEAIPPFEKLSEEATRARAIQSQVCGNKDFGKIQNQKVNIPKVSEPTLAELEHLMKSQISVHSKQDPALLEKFLNPQGGEAGTKRLDVYAAGFVARTHDGLFEAYEAIRNVIGSDEFYELSKAYISEFPSQNYNLSYVGKELPQFLTHAPLTKRFPFLVRLAELEWFCVEAFHAFDEKPFNPKELEALPLEDWERAKFSFQPSVRVMESEWPILEFWNEKKNEKFKFAPVPEAKEHLLISRRGFQVAVEKISFAQYELMKSLISGLTLNDALESLTETSEELPVAQWFQSWVSLGLITRCQIVDEKVRS